MIIGLLGSIGSGKNTVARMLVEQYGFHQESFASSLKDACAMIFCWERELLEGSTEESREWREKVDEWWATKLGIEGFTPRLALQLVGTDVMRNHFHKDIWFLSLQNKLRQNPNRNVVISDARFPNEIRMINELNGRLVRVDRGPKPEWWEVAVRAYRGDAHCEDMMRVAHGHIHESEWAWVGCEPSIIIDNNGTLGDLRNQVSRMVSPSISVKADKYLTETD
jgi:hypothetical protein